ncbi:MAG: hypothetical protein AAGB12_10760, partial [Pseudomonadota bacterium]
MKRGLRVFISCLLISLVTIELTLAQTFDIQRLATLPAQSSLVLPSFDLAKAKEESLAAAKKGAPLVVGKVTYQDIHAHKETWHWQDNVWHWT